MGGAGQLKSNRHTYEFQSELWSGCGENPRAEESFERDDCVSVRPSLSSELLYSSSSSRAVETPCRSSGADLDKPVHGRLLHTNKRTRDG